MVRIEATAESYLAAIFDRIKLGIAIAAMIKIIATTMSNSISEKPFCLLRISIHVSLDSMCTLARLSKLHCWGHSHGVIGGIIELTETKHLTGFRSPLIFSKLPSSRVPSANHDNNCLE